ncbi:MAG: DUF1501 domain-containing protein [Planctomycetia bacterium]|nr:DUF1501 domain-containing protein [Planctomycetia bacterium]
MLRLFTGQRSALCDGLHRRDFLRIGALGLGSWALGNHVQASAGAGDRSYVKDKAIVLLFLAGGPSQFETFDPKPDGLEGCTSVAGHIPTSLPGVRFASYLPKLAKLAHRLTVVRSFQTKHPEHNGAHKQLLTADLEVKDGQAIREPGLGAIYARVAGAVHSQTGMPRHALIPPTTDYLPVRAGFTGAFESVVEGAQPAWLGPAFAPFQVRAPMGQGAQRSNKKKDGDESNPLVDLLNPQVPDLQLDGRLHLLKQLDQLDRQLDQGRALADMEQFRRQAVDLLRGGAVRKAFDLSQEDPKTLAEYDTEHFRNWNCDEASKFIRNGPSVGISLGRQLLLARRLCEAGCGFVNVVHANWDFHARKNIPNIPEGMSVLAPPLDHAVAAFLTDVERRGLSDKILLVITGEFGRTPGLDKNAGRHHWPRLCPLVLAGGGLKHGQIVGQSDLRGGEPSGNPITIDDFHATLLHAVMDVHRMRADVTLPQKVHDRAQRGQPIAELF